MKNAFVTRIANTASTTLAAVTLVLAISTLLLAQQPGPRPPSSSGKPTFYPAPSSSEVERMEGDRHFRDLELLERVVSREKARPAERDREMALKQATEDFQRLLEINQQPLASPGTAVDYKRAFETTSEIEKRAVRLKSNLVLPVIVADKKRKAAVEIDEDNFRASLSELKQALTNFVTNPVFYGNGSIDAKLQMQAAHDLDGVIELSGRISKKAEKMHKTAAKSN
jgi:hypothetical protein